MKFILTIALTLCSVSSSVRADPAPAPNLGAQIGTGIVQALIARRTDLATFAGAISRSTTHEAIVEAAPELGKALREDIVSNGALSQAIKSLTVLALRDAIDTSSTLLQGALASSCGPLGTGECVRAQARSMSQEVTGGVIDELELRWPMRILAVALVLFLLTGTTLMLVVLRRMLRDDRARLVTRAA